MNTPGPESVGRYQLLASALAGRLVEVAPAEVGSPSWTDGMTIFVDPDAEVVDVVRSVAVQASLLSAGSLSPEMGANLSGRAAMVRRYLALEGHRALQAQEDLLPVGVCTLIDLSLAARTRSPVDSLTRAASREAIADPPPIFGMIRPRQLRPADERTTAGSAAQPAPLRQREEDWRELDDAGDSDGPVVDRFSSPVGGGGGLGRLLKKFAGDARSGRSGSPGADAVTRWSRSPNRVAATSVMSSATTPVADGVGGVERLGTTYPEWDVFRRRYRPEWCTVIEVDEERANRAPFELPDAHALRRPLARSGPGPPASAPAVARRRHRHRRRGRGVRRVGRGLRAGRSGLHRQPSQPPRSQRAPAARHLRLSRRARDGRPDRARAPASGCGRAHRHAPRSRRPRRPLRVPLPGSLSGRARSREALR